MMEVRKLTIGLTVERKGNKHMFYIVIRRHEYRITDNIAQHFMTQPTLQNAPDPWVHQS